MNRTSNRNQTSRKNLFSLTDLSLSSQKHLTKVYATITATIGVAILSTYYSVNYDKNGSLTGLSFFSLIASMVAFFFTSKFNQNLRLIFLLLIGASKGLMISPLIKHIIQIDPSIIYGALQGTFLIFVCFTVASLTSKKRSLLYLGGILGSCLFLMTILAIFNIFLQSTVLNSIELYGGLFIFSFYIAYDTQLILESFERGDYDYTGHALMLFTNLWAIFIRLVLIMVKNRTNNDKEKRKN